MVDGDCYERADAAAAAFQSSTHKDQRQTDSSFHIVALELIKMQIDWVHHLGGGSDLKEMAEKYPFA